VNRLIGLVPVEEDGSAHFEVPAMRSLYFHVLDKDGKMLMTQGSDFHVMPGERRSCIGCHEERTSVQVTPRQAPTPIAAKKPPLRPELPPWGTRGIIEYESVVQPVFDKHCVCCHGGAKPEGRLDLSGDRTTVFNMSYMELVDKGLVHFTPGKGRTYMQLNADYDQQAPLSRGSVLSPLTRYLDDTDHIETRLTTEEKRRIFLWIDSNIPFYGHYDQDSPTVLSEGARATLKEVYDRRCAGCHDKPDRPDTPGFLDYYSIHVHTGPRPGQWGITESGMRVRHLNLSHPERSAALQAPLAEAADGWGLCGDEGARPIFQDKTDPDYRQILEALQSGVVRRDEPGVFELLKPGEP
jgi:mono/diheme cytochrome c family protein